jgi:hypothetical protein
MRPLASASIANADAASLDRSDYWFLYSLAVAFLQASCTTKDRHGPRRPVVVLTVTNDGK